MYTVNYYSILESINVLRFLSLLIGNFLTFYKELLLLSFEVHTSLLRQSDLLFLLVYRSLLIAYTVVLVIAILKSFHFESMFLDTLLCLCFHPFFLKRDCYFPRKLSAITIYFFSNYLYNLTNINLHSMYLFTLWVHLTSCAKVAFPPFYLVSRLSEQSYDLFAIVVYNSASVACIFSSND